MHPTACVRPSVTAQRSFVPVPAMRAAGIAMMRYSTRSRQALPNNTRWLKPWRGEGFGPSTATQPRHLYRLAEPLGWFNRERYPSMRLRRYHTKTELRARAERAPNHWVDRCPSVDQRPAGLTERSQPLCMEIDTVVGRKTDVLGRLPTHPVHLDRILAALHRCCRGDMAARLCASFTCLWSA